jgi:hypothetical protein
MADEMKGTGSTLRQPEPTTAWRSGGVGPIVAGIFLIGAAVTAMESVTAYADTVTRQDLTRLETDAADESEPSRLRLPLQMSGAASLRELDAGRALLETPPDLDLAEKRSWEALSRSPSRAESWARLAFVDVAQNQRLTPEGLDALNHSFIALPFAGDSFQVWRVQLALTYWSQLDAEAQRHVTRAIDALAVGVNGREALQGIVEQIPEAEARRFLQSRL